jgi:hypothetical protein
MTAEKGRLAEEPGQASGDGYAPAAQAPRPGTAFWNITFMEYSFDVILAAWTSTGRRSSGGDTVVVALYATDKAKLGDVFYDGVAARADPMIDQWKRETAYEEKP